jgi:hypothetical protein
MKKVAILQSNYIPWKGYFHIIQKADHFVFLDSAQYTVRDWRNRNQIKTPQGLLWLTVPNNGTQSKRIDEVRIDTTVPWKKKHLSALQRNYSECEYFEEYFGVFKNFLLNDLHSLSKLNQFLIKKICGLLGIHVKFSNSTEYDLVAGKNEKIISIVKQLNGTHYVTGPAAKSYIQPQLFEENGIEIEFMDYSHYPIYDQPWGKFSHNVSILDLLFCTGSQSYKYIWGEKR